MRDSLATGRSRSVGLSVSIDRSFGNFLASSQRRRNSSRCEHHDLSPCLEPLSRLPFHGDHSPPEDVHRNNFSKRIIHSSILTVPLSDSPTNGSERHFAACATTHIPQVQLDRVLF